MSRNEASRPPIHGYRHVVDEWLGRDEYKAAGLDNKVQFNVAYTEQGSESGYDEVAEQWPTGQSWLGGPAGGIHPSQWPRRSDGQPLAHIASFDLAEAEGVLDGPSRASWPSTNEDLPDHGVLQIFHDLETYGTDAADGQLGAWSVRWLEEPDRGLLSIGPDDLDLPSDACQAVTALATFSMPVSLDLGVTTQEAFDANERATEAFERMWNWQRTTNPDAGPMSITHLYGYSQAGNLAVESDVLPDRLPLTLPGDGYRLVADIESWTTLEGWFGDGSPLEVWMRQSDLDSRRFENAWCIIRAD